MTSFFPKRLGRLAWLGRLLLFLVPAVVLLVLTDRRGALRPYLGDMLGEIISWAIVGLGLFYTLFFIHLPRCRSLGLHGAGLLLLIIPIANICLFMMFLFGGEGYWTRITNRNSPTAKNENNVA